MISVSGRRFPDRCRWAASADGQCQALEAAGWQPSGHDVAHHLVSGYSGSAMTIGLLTLTVGMVRGGVGPAARGWGIPLLALLVTSELRGAHLLGTLGRLGTAQRVGEAGETIFVLAVAWDLGRPSPPGRIGTRPVITRTAEVSSLAC